MQVGKRGQDHQYDRGATLLGSHLGGRRDATLYQHIAPKLVSPVQGNAFIQPTSKQPTLLVM